MLKTNSKKAIENIRAYIMKNFDCSNYDVTEYGFTKEPETFPEIARCILTVCKLEKRYQTYNREFDMFKDWCQGLPSLLDTCYYYNRSAVDDLAEILEESEEEKNRFTESEAEEKLTYLIYRELTKAERSGK